MKTITIGAIRDSDFNERFFVRGKLNLFVPGGGDVVGEKNPATTSQRAFARSNEIIGTLRVSVLPVSHHRAIIVRSDRPSIDEINRNAFTRFDSTTTSELQRPRRTSNSISKTSCRFLHGDVPRQTSSTSFHGLTGHET